CRRRHDELHRHLIGARSRLRQALDDRFRRPPRSVRRFDIGADLLTPYLARSTAVAAEATGRMLAVVGGTPVRWWPPLATLTDELCAPPLPAPAGDEFHPAEFDVDERSEWWESYEATVDAVLDGIEQPIRLSQLLARVDLLAARVEVDDLDGEPLDPGILAAAFVHAAHQAWAARLTGRSAGDRVLVGVRTGTEVDHVGIRSDDLLLVPGEVTADINEPAPVAHLRARPSDIDEIDEEAG
ncbi:MAG TPA: hypothetical protein VGJ28_25260, partial [Micromonosporaceae bacterium]